MRNYIFILLVAGCLVRTEAGAQVGIINEVVSVVGENIITKAEWETEYLQVAVQYENYPGNLKCEVLSQLISQKLLLHWAAVDSVIVGDDRIGSELNRRIAYYASQIGGEERLEQYLGKTIIEYKDEIRPKIREQLTVQEMQSTILADVKVTPTEVRRFYNEIPKDSLPLFDAEVEVAQLIVKPEPSEIARKYAYETIQQIRKDIVNGGSDFATVASIKSDDIGSRENGGDLGYFSRGQMVAAFERAAFSLQKDSVSPIVESEYGYHIIKMIDRRGEKVRARHILIKPLIVNSDLQKARNKMKEVKQKLEAGEIDFCTAVDKYGSDDQGQTNCGFFTDPALGSTKQEITMLDPNLIVIIEEMTPGSYTDVLPIQMPDGSTAFRIIYLKSKSKPHRANLTDDYQKIQVFALEKKKKDVLEEWVKKHKQDTYISVDSKHKKCSELNKWLVN